jgi:hypothetical protein
MGGRAVEGTGLEIRSAPSRKPPPLLHHASGHDRLTYPRMPRRFTHGHRPPMEAAHGALHGWRGTNCAVRDQPAERRVVSSGGEPINRCRVSSAMPAEAHVTSARAATEATRPKPTTKPSHSTQSESEEADRGPRHHVPQRNRGSEMIASRKRPISSMEALVQPYYRSPAAVRERSAGDQIHSSLERGRTGGGQFVRCAPGPERVHDTFLVIPAKEATKGQRRIACPGSPLSRE